MIEYPAKVPCDVAGKACNPERCTSCTPLGNGRFLCTYWPQFIDESQAAVLAVRDYARLDSRNKPRHSYKFTATEWVE